MNDWQGYYTACAAAYVRGEAIRARENGGRITTPDGKSTGRRLDMPPELIDLPLEALTVEQIEAILARGRDAGLNLYCFKKSLGELPRVKYVLEHLRTLAFDSILDVGSGRGKFLWPCLDAFPNAKVRSVDLSRKCVCDFDAVRLGGVSNLFGTQEDFCQLNEPDGSYDVVTLIEVLEHILPVAAAVNKAVRLAKKCVIVSALTRPDDDPEHVHLLTREVLTRLFHEAGCKRLCFDEVNGHLLLIACKEG